jgi:MFS family permease
MAALDTAIANIALPAIAADLNTTPADVIWVVNVYQIAMVTTLLPFAALGEIIGHQRIYLWGLLLFTVASLACALAWSLPTLLIARVLQGLGAAGVMSVNTALVRFVYPPIFMDAASAITRWWSPPHSPSVRRLHPAFWRWHRGPGCLRSTFPLVWRRC